MRGINKISIMNPASFYSSGTYLHSHYEYFDAIFAMQNQLLTIKNLSTAMENQRQKSESKFNELLGFIGVSESDLLYNLSKATSTNTLESAFNNAKQDLISSLESQTEKDIEKEFYSIVERSVYNYINGTETSVSHRRQFSNAVNATKVSSSGDVTLVASTSKKYDSHALNAFKQFIIESISQELKMNASTVKALFSGDQISSELMIASLVAGAKLSDKKSNRKFKNLQKNNSDALLKNFKKLVYEDVIADAGVASKNILDAAISDYNIEQIAMKNILTAFGGSNVNASATTTKSLSIENKVKTSTLEIILADSSGLMDKIGVNIVSSATNKMPKDLNIKLGIDDSNSIDYLINRMMSIDGADKDQINQLKYVMVNYAFLNNASNNMQDFLKNAIGAYVGVMIGTDIIDGIDDDFMNIGLIYLPQKNIAIPIYRMIDSLLQTLQDNNNNWMDFSISDNSISSQKNSFYSEKRRVLKKYRAPNNVFIYPDYLMTVGYQQGAQASGSIKYSLSLNISKEILKASRF